MQIAICGASLPPFDKSILKKAYEIGKEIAINNHTLRFGGCWGYPFEAAKGAFEAKGRVIAVSPAKNKDEHINIYKFPTENFTEIKFTGLEIPGRNLPLVVDSDAIIIISGQIGTLNEFTIAFHHKKPIGVVEGSGGITELVDQIAKICNKVGERDRIIYEKEPKKLVEKLNQLNNNINNQ
ncbi:LOG family protein [Candidatus Woesearchaeota archaeon]|nr:LOG family protein [Candidatus Woesearchaeota archaeon]